MPYVFACCLPFADAAYAPVPMFSLLLDAAMLIVYLYAYARFYQRHAMLLATPYDATFYYAATT